MEITTNIHFSTEEINELSRILNCSNAEIPQELSSISAAALREYVNMFLGQKVFSRGSDLLEYRLFLLIEEALGNKIPDEHEVSHLFQTTATESRSLIRSVMSKYQYKLKVAIQNSLIEIIQTARQENDDGPFFVIINSQNLVNELNRILAEIDGSLQFVSKSRGCVSTYMIQASSYARIREYLAIEPV